MWLLTDAEYYEVLSYTSKGLPSLISKHKIISMSESAEKNI